MSEKAKYVNPRWLEEGMKVLIRYADVCSPEEKKEAEARRAGLRCTVMVAAGSHGRVVNEARKVEGWFSLYDLWVPADDPHA